MTSPASLHGALQPDQLTAIDGHRELQAGGGETGPFGLDTQPRLVYLPTERPDVWLLLSESRIEGVVRTCDLHEWESAAEEIAIDCARCPFCRAVIDGEPGRTRYRRRAAVR